MDRSPWLRTVCCSPPLVIAHLGPALAIGFWLIPVCRPRRYAEISFTRHPRQAATGRCANPTLVGGSDDEAAGTATVRARALRQGPVYLGVGMSGESFVLNDAQRGCVIGALLGTAPATRFVRIELSMRQGEWTGKTAVSLAVAEIATFAGSLCVEQRLIDLVQRWSWWPRNANSVGPQIDAVLASVLVAHKAQVSSVIQMFVMGSIPVSRRWPVHYVMPADAFWAYYPQPQGGH